MGNSARATGAIILAVMAAVLYAINIPLSKLLMDDVAPTFMAAFLYIGAGVGVGIMGLVLRGRRVGEARLEKSDMVYTVGMVVLDICAPILLMYGIRYGTSANASLLGNFEIVATSLIALVFFAEAISPLVWLGIATITGASIMLTFTGGGMDFSYGSLFVLAATICWGVENNFTRKISDKSTYQIVTVKGIFSGLGSFMVALMLGEDIPALLPIVLTLLLGFVVYGLSIFVYVRAQASLGAARTSAYYGLAPFIGVFFSFVLVGEQLTLRFALATLLMALGAGLITLDTMRAEKNT